MGHTNNMERATDKARANDSARPNKKARANNSARPPVVDREPKGVRVAVPPGQVGLDLIVREVLQVCTAKASALLRVHLHSRKVRAAARDLAEALAESRDVWNWPGDRLPVGDEMSQHVEKLTHRLKVETEAHHRLEALSRTVGWGRSVQAV